MGIFSCSYSVRRLSPREPRGIRPMACRQDSDGGQHRPERAPVGHVDLAAPARLARELVERRLEHHRAEVHAGDLQGVQAGGEPLGVDPRGAQQLERPRGAAPL